MNSADRLKNPDLIEAIVILHHDCKSQKLKSLLFFGPALRSWPIIRSLMRFLRRLERIESEVQVPFLAFLVLLYEMNTTSRLLFPVNHTAWWLCGKVSHRSCLESPMLRCFSRSIFT